MFDFGQYNEFSDGVTRANPVIMAVAKAIELNPYVGRFYQMMGAPAATIKTKDFKIFDRTKTSRDGVLGGAWDADDITGLAINADALKGITIGHVLQVESEVVIISAVNRDAGTISVYKRGDAGTTGAAHSNGESFYVIGFAGSDTDLKNIESVSEATRDWTNYVQTVFETIDWTKHAELMQQGLSSENAIIVLVREAEIRIAEILARMSIRGVKNVTTGSGTRYMSAGLLAQLRDSERNGRTYNANGLLTEVKFKASLKELFDDGGNAGIILVSPTVKEYVNAFLGSFANRVVTDQASNHVAGGIYVDSYNYEGKILKVEVDKDMFNNQIAVIELGDCKKGWLENDGLRLTDEPAPSSREFRKALQGSLGFIIENVGRNHTLITGITGGTTERTLPVSVPGGVTVSGGVAVSELPVPVATYQQINVNADADVPAAAAANIGLRVKITTAWSGGTKIVTAVVGEIYASNGAAWVKQ